MLQGEKICKNFDSFPVLRDVNIHVPKGCVYGLVGPNGAGKSTLLRHIAGIFRQDSGTLLLDGEPVYENVAAKRRMAFIPDDIFYFRQATLSDMMKYYRGMYPQFDTQLFAQLCEQFPELNGRRKLRQMSKGMQKQAAFALAISAQPELLCLDEPVDGLDPVMRRQIWGILLAQVEQQKLTVVVSSHNLRELEDVCDYVGILHHGSILLERSLNELQEGIVKLQVAFAQACPDLSEEFEILHQSSVGKVHTWIVRGQAQEIEQRLAPYEPILMDILPLTLEEIFIYEMGGMDYEVKAAIL